MILTFHDGFCVRASAGDTTIVFGPVSKSSKNFKPTNFGADVAFVSFNHPDMNGIEEAGRGDKQPFFVTGPGEYEIKDIATFGFASKSKYGGEERTNTIYSVNFDGLTVMYAGAVGTTELPKISRKWIPRRAYCSGGRERRAFAIRRAEIGGEFGRRSS